LLFYFFTPSRRLKRMLKQVGVPPDRIAEQAAKLVEFQSDAILRLIKTHDKLFVGYTYQSVSDQLLKKLVEQGVPIFQGPERAARAIDAAYRYTCLREKILASASHKEAVSR
jgi:acyl-CoA synthetase (NDP forming)